MSIPDPIEFRRLRPVQAPRPDATAKCTYAEAFEEAVEPILAGIPAALAKVPAEQKEVIFAQARSLILLAYQDHALGAPAIHRNAANRRAHPCTHHSLHAVLVRLRELHRQIVPQLDVRKKGTTAPRPAPPIVNGIWIGDTDD